MPMPPRQCPPRAHDSPHIGGATINDNTRRKVMKRNLLIAMSSVSVLIGATSATLGQVAGSTPLGVAVTELSVVTTGWSAKRQILGQTVYNDSNEKVGKVDDIIVAPDKAISYAIVGAGGFLGVGKHDVAIPVNQFKADDGKLVLAGASKDVLKAMPEFEYAY
jgi:sporulation protein YlmC with PRC-barrel domain